MELNKKLLGNNKPQKIIIDAREETFDFTLYKTHVVIIVDGTEKYNENVEILIASKDQKIKFVIDFPVCGYNISVKIETNCNQSLSVKIEDIE